MAHPFMESTPQLGALLSSAYEQRAFDDFGMQALRLAAMNDMMMKGGVASRTQVRAQRAGPTPAGTKRGEEGRVYCGKRVTYHDGPQRWRGHKAGSCRCDGRCGPGNGCQCKSCYEATFGTGNRGKEGRVYCGKRGVKYHNGPRRWRGHADGACSCDGQCGPGNGCQCKDCYVATFGEGNRGQEGRIYCGKRGVKYHNGPKRWAGHSDGRCACDGQCGPSNGCQCKDCYVATYGEGASAAPVQIPRGVGLGGIVAFNPTVASLTKEDDVMDDLFTKQFAGFFQKINSDVFADMDAVSRIARDAVNAPSCPASEAHNMRMGFTSYDWECDGCAKHFECSVRHWCCSSHTTDLCLECGTKRKSSPLPDMKSQRPSCKDCSKPMEFIIGDYSCYGCDKCNGLVNGRPKTKQLFNGRRWHCARCKCDFCNVCAPPPEGSDTNAACRGSCAKQYIKDPLAVSESKKQQAQCEILSVAAHNGGLKVEFELISTERQALQDPTGAEIKAQGKVTKAKKCEVTFKEKNTRISGFLYFDVPPKTFTKFRAGSGFAWCTMPHRFSTEEDTEKFQIGDRVWALRDGVQKVLGTITELPVAGDEDMRYGIRWKEDDGYDTETDKNEGSRSWRKANKVPRVDLTVMLSSHYEPGMRVWARTTVDKGEVVWRSAKIEKMVDPHTYEVKFDATKQTSRVSIGEMVHLDPAEDVWLQADVAHSELFNPDNDLKPDDPRLKKPENEQTTRIDDLPAELRPYVTGVAEEWSLRARFWRAWDSLKSSLWSVVNKVVCLDVGFARNFLNMFMSKPFKPLPGDVKVAVFMAGCAGAGKSTAWEREGKKKVMELYNLSSLDNLVMIDIDKLRECDPIWKDKSTPPDVKVKVTQGKSGFASDTMRRKCLDEKSSFVQDGTLRSSVDFINTVNVIRDKYKGYKVVVLYVRNSLAVCYKQAVSRAKRQRDQGEPPRDVPMDYLIDCFRQVEENHLQGIWAAHADKYIVIDNREVEDPHQR